MPKVLKSRNIKDLRDKWLKEQKGKDALHTDFKIENPTLDHNHYSSFCRGVLDRDINQFLGKVESAHVRFLKHKIPDLVSLLRRTAYYLEKGNRENEQIIHPKSITTMVNKFGYLPSEEQISVLKEAYIEPGANKRVRCKQYRKYLMRKENLMEF